MFKINCLLRNGLLRKYIVKKISCKKKNKLSIYGEGILNKKNISCMQYDLLV